MSCEGVKDVQQYVDRGDGFRGRHPWADEISRTITTIGEQWQDSEIDSRTDYFDVRYYFNVELPDEWMQQWRQGEREAAARRRAARAAS